MTNSQAATHDASPLAPAFNREQSTSVSLILQEPADATRTQPHDPPPTLFLHANSVVIRENIFDSSGESNQGFRDGT